MLSVLKKSFANHKSIDDIPNKRKDIASATYIIVRRNQK